MSKHFVKDIIVSEETEQLCDALDRMFGTGDYRRSEYVGKRRKDEAR